MGVSAATSPEPLAELHDEAGVESWSDIEGHRTPGRYARLEDEYGALADGVGVVDRTLVDSLVLSGPDRLRFLDGLVTCPTAELEVGEVRYGFVTDVKGRVLADAVVVAGADRLLIELPPGRGPAIAEHLAEYRIADRVEIESSPYVAVSLLGPELGDARLGAPPADWSARFDGVEAPCVAVDRRPVLGLDALTAWVEPAAVPALWRRLTAEMRPVGWEAVDVHRVERGMPRFGADFGPDTFPQETGLEERAVSYEKGCYLGQEVVARIHYRGRVNRRLVGLLFAGDETPAAGAVVSDGERGAGEVRSAVRSIALDRPIGLALVHRRVADPGTSVEIEDGARAEVVELPFVD